MSMGNHPASLSPEVPGFLSCSSPAQDHDLDRHLVVGVSSDMAHFRAVRRQFSRAEPTQELKSDSPEIQSQYHHVPAVWPWASYVISWKLHFLTDMLEARLLNSQCFGGGSRMPTGEMYLVLVLIAPLLPENNFLESHKTLAMLRHRLLGKGLRLWNKIDQCQNQVLLLIGFMTLNKLQKLWGSESLPVKQEEFHGVHSIDEKLLRVSLFFDLDLVCAGQII